MNAIALPLEIAGVVVCLALAVAGIVYHVIRRRLPKCTLLDLPLAAYALALALSCLTSVDLGRSLLYLLVWLACLGVYRVMLIIPARSIALAFTILGGLSSGLWLYEFARTHTRLSTMIHPNLMASWLVLVLFLGCSTPLWWLWNGAALLTTGSRGAILGLLVAIATRLRIRLWWAIPALLVAGIALTALRPGTALGRLDTWREAVSLFAQRPLLGWGIGCYRDVAQLVPGYLHADNAPLTVAAETGVVGLAAWTWLVVSVARVAARSASSARLGLLAWGVQQLVDHTLWYPWVGLAVMACLAIVVREDGLEPRQDGTS
jgi:hypothetical protein